MLHVRVSWVRSGGKVFLLIIFHLKMFIYIFVFSRVAFVQCVFFSSIWFAPSEQEPKKCHLYVCHILRRCGSFFVLFGFFFLLFCSRQMWMKRWILFIYTNTRNHIYIYNFFFAYNITSCSVVGPLFFAVPQMFNWMADVVYQSVLFSIMLFFCNVFLFVLQCDEEEKMRFKFAGEKKIAAFRQWFRVKCAVIQEHTEQ